MGCRRSERQSDTLNRLRSLGGLECETGPSGFRLAGRGSGLANLESGVTPCPQAPPPPGAADLRGQPQGQPGAQHASSRRQALG